MIKLNNDADNSQSPYIETIDNHIYLYFDITSELCLDLIKAIRETEYLARMGNDIPIFLHINSNGGNGLSAFAVADQINDIKLPVYSIVEGVCASAATIISMACTKRYITKNSFMLLHQLSGEMWGHYEQMKDDLGMLEMLMDNITQFYVDHSRIEEAEIREILKRNSWFNAKRCVELGLVDEIKL